MRPICALFASFFFNKHFCYKVVRLGRGTNRPSHAGSNLAHDSRRHSQFNTSVETIKADVACGSTKACPMDTSSELTEVINMPQYQFLTKRSATCVLAFIAAEILIACGGGGGSAINGDPSGVVVETSSVTVSGLIWNSPIDGIELRVTCADGSTGGAGVASKGTYSVTVSCSATNFPVVIATSGDGLSAGPDMQFGTLDDYTFKSAERSPLKVAIDSSSTATANLTALSTLAAQPIEDRIAAYKAAPTVSVKPTAADVAAVEGKVKAAFGFSSLAIP